MFKINSFTKIVLVLTLLISFSCFAQSQDNNASPSSQSDDRIKIRLGFVVENSIYRQILLTVDDRASMDYDFGFDGPLIDDFPDDFSWIINDENYVIQGIDHINISNTFLPLYLKKDTDGLVTISIDALENVPDAMDVYLYDTDLNLFHDLRGSNYEAIVNSGLYDNRYYLVFQNQVPPSLSVAASDLDQLDFYYATSREKLVILNPTSVELKYFEIYDISGKKVYNQNSMWNNSYNEYPLGNLITGVYIVKLISAQNQVLTKKIIVK